VVDINTSQDYINRIMWVRKTAHELMAEHGLLAQGWKFRLSTAQRQVGVCKYPNSRHRGYIEYSTHFLKADDHEIIDTILHEIAHALAGHAAGHNYLWKMYARQVGARPETCVTSSHAAASTVKPNFTIKCPECGWSTTRQRVKRHLIGHMLCPRCPDKPGVVLKVYRILNGR